MRRTLEKTLFATSFLGHFSYAHFTSSRGRPLSQRLSGRTAASTVPLAPDFTWGEDPVRGVNIGGWLVLEPWITPSIFESKPDWVVDEWTYGQYMATGNDTVGEITNHWENWYTQEVFENIAAVGLNTVRIPIGFWSLIPLENGEPYLVGAFEYLKLAVGWARDLNLKVMIDLHGAPGSQNGYDNSGLRGTRAWFNNETNVERSLTAVQVLVSEFTQSSYESAVASIELVNEPFPYSTAQLDFLKSYYDGGYTSVRETSQQRELVVVLHEAYQGLAEWSGFMTEPNYSDVALDIHIYSMFDLDTIALGYVANLEWTCAYSSALQASDADIWTVVGEFTAANTDCALWLNGRGTGSRYDNTLNGTESLKFPGTCAGKTGADPSGWDQEYIDHLGQSFETQTWVYELASGWIYWCWRTEQAADWSLETGISYGWIPTPITAKPHGTPCNFTTAAATSAEIRTAAPGGCWEGGAVLVSATLIALVVLI